MRGGFFGEAVLVELDAGEQNHVVAAPGALPLPLDDAEVFVELVGAESAVAEAGKPADYPARVREMIGNADAIEAEPSVEIDQVRHGQRAIGIVAVHVKIAQKHSRSGVFPARA